MITGVVSLNFYKFDRFWCEKAVQSTEILGFRSCLLFCTPDSRHGTPVVELISLFTWGFTAMFITLFAIMAALFAIFLIYSRKTHFYSRLFNFIRENLILFAKPIREPF